MMELALLVAVPVILFIIGSLGFALGCTYQSNKDMIESIWKSGTGRQGFDRLMYKGSEVIPSKDVKAGEIRLEEKQPIKPKKKPTRSAVMKNPSPQEIRKNKEKEALALQMESLAVEKRESGSGEVPATIEL